MMNKDTFTARQAWRHGLKVGDLVMMKHGGMALITKVISHVGADFADDPSPPHIEMTYCDDNTPGSCSSYRIERLLSETR
jgi:hypothetical protein